MIKTKNITWIVIGLAVLFLMLNPFSFTGAVTTPCTDTDGGVNVMVRGTVDGDPSPNFQCPSPPCTDFCDTFGSTEGIREFSCSQSSGIIRSDPMSCPPGTSCSNGECVAEASCGDGNVDVGEDCDGSNLNGESCTSLGFDGGTLSCDSYCVFDFSGCIYNNYCYDSDGTNLYNKGYIRVVYNDDEQVYTDHCQYPYNNVVNEFICDGDIGDSVDVTCPTGELCEDGVCVEQVCNTQADSNCDGLVSNTELLISIGSWVDDLMSNEALLNIISAWVNS